MSQFDPVETEPEEPVEEPAEEEPAAPEEPASHHVVQPGDTLQSIAEQYSMDPVQLAGISVGHLDRVAAARGFADSAGGTILMVGDVVPLVAAGGQSASTAGSSSAELARMAQLHDSGAISDDEYASVKARLLARV